MPLTITDEQLQQCGMTAPELRAAMAAFLFDRRRLKLDEARQLADMDLASFQQMLEQYNIFLTGTRDKAVHDRQSADGLQPED